MGSCKNSVSAYDNTMKNSDGSYNAIPGAKAKQVHYTALYITLSELAAEAQKNGYKSPNNSGRSFDIQIEKQANTKVTVANDGKSALIGPYKLKIIIHLYQNLLVQQLTQIKQIKLKL